MVLKRQTQESFVNYSLNFSHNKIVEMINDDDVNFIDGSVSNNQTFNLSIINSNGSKENLHNFNSSQTLSIRFRHMSILTSGCFWKKIQVKGRLYGGMTISGEAYTGTYNESSSGFIRANGLAENYMIQYEEFEGGIIANAVVNNVTELSRIVVSNIIGPSLRTPYSIVVDDDGNIYTCNYGDMVLQITPTGEYSVFAFTITSLDNFGNYPLDLTIDGDGNIYTCNYSSNNVSKITPWGMNNSSILGTTGSKPTGIVIDSDGNIYTANYGSNNVSKITPDGVSTILGTTEIKPIDLAIDSEGNIYTANYGSNNVSKITPDGVSTILGITGKGPHGIAVDSEGNIYTCNSFFGAYNSDNVSKITPAGVSSILGTTGSRPEGIVVDGEGNIYTSNYDSDNVSKITPAGVSTIFATTGRGPTKITIDSEGNIYTANVTAGNVSKISMSLFSE